MSDEDNSKKPSCYRNQCTRGELFSWPICYNNLQPGGKVMRRFSLQNLQPNVERPSSFPLANEPYAFSLNTPQIPRLPGSPPRCLRVCIRTSCHHAQPNTLKSHIFSKMASLLDTPLPVSPVQNLPLFPHFLQLRNELLSSVSMA